MLVVDDASLLQLVLILKLLTVVWRFLEDKKKMFKHFGNLWSTKTQRSHTLRAKILPRPSIILRFTEKKNFKNQLQNPFLESE